jgi:hypothetical protein
MGLEYLFLWWQCARQLEYVLFGCITDVTITHRRQCNSSISETTNRRSDAIFVAADVNAPSRQQAGFMPADDRRKDGLCRLILNQNVEGPDPSVSH